MLLVKVAASPYAVRSPSGAVTCENQILHSTVQAPTSPKFPWQKKGLGGGGDEMPTISEKAKLGVKRIRCESAYVGRNPPSPKMQFEKICRRCNRFVETTYGHRQWAISP